MFSKYSVAQTSAPAKETQRAPMPTTTAAAMDFGGTYGVKRYTTQPPCQETRALEGPGVAFTALLLYAGEAGC